jgi:arsenate reductase
VSAPSPPEPFDVVIYHNPACGTSRNTLALIRNAGVEPHVVEYLKSPPARAMLRRLLARAGLFVRDVLREKGTPFAELGLADPSLSDDALLDAVEAHPILLNRPLVVSPKGVRLCRPSETVIDLLPPQRGEFVKEDARNFFARPARQGDKGLGHVFGRVDQGTVVNPLPGQVCPVREAGRIDDGREHAADMDVGVAPELLAQARRDAAQAELRRCVGGPERVRHPGAERDGVDKYAMTLAQEEG